MNVCIIGAGAAGLASIKTCLEHGFAPLALEQSDYSGGLWAYKQHVTPGISSVMKSTVVNTSKEMTAFSDHLVSEHFANYMHNEQLLAYLRSYAERFELEKYVKFGCNVVDVSKNDDYVKTGRWTVVWQCNGETHKQVFDAVMVCVGHFAYPYMPVFAGREHFTGKIIHSHEYRHPGGLESSRVIVVGIGNSACDIAVELSRVCKQVYLVSRRGAWLKHRLSLGGLPTDIVSSTRFWRGVNSMSYTFFAWRYCRAIRQRVDHDLYGLRPPHTPLQAHPTVNDELTNRLASGTIILKPEIDCFLDDSNNGVQFVDGSHVSDIDLVVAATGYQYDKIPCLERAKLMEHNEDFPNEVPLYEYVFAPGVRTLGVIGQVQPLASTITISEMQARWFCQVLSGACKLPSNDEQRAHIRRTRAILSHIFIDSRRHTIILYDPYGYTDRLADRIGCRPVWWHYLLSDPRLAYWLLFGPIIAAQYRLVGPHSWKGARNAIVNVMDRVRTGMNPAAMGFAHQEKHAKNHTMSLCTATGAMLFCAALLTVCYWHRHRFP